MLTAKQARFCECLANGMNKTQAYKLAYSCEHYESEGAIRVDACRLAKHPEVVRTVQALRDECRSTKRVVADLHSEWIVMRLMDLVDSPYSNGATKVRALEVLGKSLGMFDKKHHVQIEHRSPEEIEAELEAVLAQFLPKDSN